MSPVSFWVSAGEEKRNYGCCWAQAPQFFPPFSLFPKQSWTTAAPGWQPACVPLSLTLKHCSYGRVFTSAWYFACLVLNHRWTQHRLTVTQLSRTGAGMRTLGLKFLTPALSTSSTVIIHPFSSSFLANLHHRGQCPQPHKYGFQQITECFRTLLPLASSTAQSAILT